MPADDVSESSSADDASEISLDLPPFDDGAEDKSCEKTGHFVPYTRLDSLSSKVQTALQRLLPAGSHVSEW